MSQVDFTAAIFDLDGTLIDSMGVWNRVDKVFLSKRNLVSPPNYVSDISFMSFHEAAVYTKEVFGLPDGLDEIKDEWFNLALNEYSHNVKLKPYALDYLERLKSKGKKLAVATSLTVRLMEPVMKSNGIYDIFDVISSADLIGCGKGTPDIFLRTAENLGASPENCIVFEDIVTGIKSAKAAGMTAYAVYDANSEKDREELTRVSDGYLENFSQAPLF